MLDKYELEIDRFKANLALEEVVSMQHVILWTPEVFSVPGGLGVDRAHVSFGGTLQTLVPLS